jgi:hypothetical protein
LITRGFGKKPQNGCDALRLLTVYQPLHGLKKGLDQVVTRMKIFKDVLVAFEGIYEWLQRAGE